MQKEKDMEVCMDNHDEYITRIVTDYSDLLLRLALHHTSELATAEDIVQTTFLRCMTSAPVFASATHERAWLIRTCINLCHDYYRSAWKRHLAPMNDEMPAEPAPSPSHEVLDAVRKLPPRERTAVYLYYYLDLPVKQISAIMEEKEGTVTSRLYRARQRLRGMLKEVEDDE